MIAHDLTKFTLLIVLLGGVLAMAVFRTQIFPTAPVKPHETDGQEQGGAIHDATDESLDEGEKGRPNYEDLLAWQEALERRQGELDRLGIQLAGREADLKESADSLQSLKENLSEQASVLAEKDHELAEQLAFIKKERTRLPEEWDALRTEQARFAEEWDNLQTQRADLTQEREALEAGRALLDAEWAQVQARNANLANREQKLEGQLRWSVAALVVATIMAGPSVLVLATWVRQDLGISGGRVQRIAAHRLRLREQIARQGMQQEPASAPPHGGNGRGKESVGYPM